MGVRTGDPWRIDIIDLMDTGVACAVFMCSLQQSSPDHNAASAPGVAGFFRVFLQVTENPVLYFNITRRPWAWLVYGLCATGEWVVQ